MRIEEVRFKNVSLRPALVVKMNDDQPIAVLLQYLERTTILPRALTKCGKRRKMVMCTILRPHGDGIHMLGQGMSFCRPPDKFDAEEGCRRAFQRAIDDFYSRVKHVDPKGAGSLIQKLWSQFVRTKAWQRMLTVKSK